METKLSGSAFQILAAATGKARLPTVESLNGGTVQRDGWCRARGAERASTRYIGELANLGYT